MGRADRIFRRLLRLFPAEFRGDFGDDMAETFRDAQRDTIGRGGAGAHLALWVRTIGGILTTAPSEHFDLLRQDLLSGVRSLRRSPAFSVVAIVIFAVGIGATTAMFTVVDQVLWRPLPYADPAALIRVRGGQSYLDLQDWTQATTTFSAFGGFRPQPFDVRTMEGSERLPGALVTGTFFDTLGIQPHRGRLISAADDQAGGERVVVITHGFWQRRFGGRGDVLGLTLDMVPERYRVVGILPAGFEMPFAPAEIIAPARVDSIEFGYRGVHSLQTVGRLKPGVTLAVAQAEMDAVAARLEEQYPDQNKGRRFVVQDLRAGIVGGIESTLLLLFSAVALLLIVACGNLASLLLARSVERRPEMAVRIALGAGRGRLLRQLFAESLSLCAIGGALGVFVAIWLLDVMLALGAADVPRLDRTALDARVLAFTAAAALFAGVASAWVPAWSLSRTALHGLAGTSGASARRRRVGAALITMEIALTVVLMVGASLLFNSVARLKRVETGFNADQRLSFNLTLRQPPRQPTPASRAEAAARAADEIARRSAFFDQVLDGLLHLPGVLNVAASTDLPFATGSSFHNLTIEGRAFPAGAEPEVHYRGVNAGFHRAMGISLLRGRELTTTDRRGGPPVAVANETFVRQFFPGEDALGKRVRWSGSEQWITIVGVSADVRNAQLDADEVPAIYGLFSQDQAVWRRSMNFAVEVSGDPMAIAPDVRRVVGSLDPTIPVLRMKTLTDLLNESMGTRRLALGMLGMFATTALGLAAVGLYGVVVYSVRTRTRELGLRMALGARPANVVGLILRQACWLMGIGLVLGLAGAYAVVGTLTNLLFEITPTDAPTYLAASALVIVTTLLSAGLPAARAARIDPLIALRRN